jgi:NodT family efflux transporter outer membrane factor (OMF) lipoprotein
MVSVRAILTTTLCAALGACAEVGPDYRVPPGATVNAPAANGAFVAGGSAVSDAPLPDHWWHLFDDPMLDGLVEKALASNDDLRAAQANLERSQALLAEVRTNREPSVTADASTTYTQQSAQAVLSHVQPPRHEIYNLGLTMSYDLDLFGGIRRGIEAASANTDAAAAARDLVRVNVAAETARAYADLCNAGNQIEVVEHVIAVQQQSLALIHELVANGRAAPFEEGRQQSPIETSRAQLAPLRARQLNAAFRLATLMGQPPESYDRSLLACHTPLKLDTLMPTGDGQALLKRRPDVREAERRLAASTAEIGVTTAELYPDIRIVATIGSTGAASSFLTPLTNRFGVGPAVTWDLHRSAVRDRISAAEAQSRVSLANFDSTVLTALRETETSLDNYAAALDQLQRLEAARDEARDVAQRTEELRAGGKVGGLVALDAQRSWIATEVAVAATQAEVNSDQISAFMALGGGWN